MSVKLYIAQMRLIRKGLQREAEKIASMYSKDILDFIREKQLYQRGVDGNNERLIPYTPFTIALKKLKGEVYDRTTLLDTGDFYESMAVRMKGDLLIVIATDVKTPDLLSKYGNDILIFTVENIAEINENIFGKHLIKWTLDQIKM